MLQSKYSPFILPTSPLLPPFLLLPWGEAPWLHLPGSMQVYLWSHPLVLPPGPYTHKLLQPCCAVFPCAGSTFPCHPNTQHIDCTQEPKLLTATRVCISAASAWPNTLLNTVFLQCTVQTDTSIHVLDISKDNLWFKWVIMITSTFLKPGPPIPCITSQVNIALINIFLKGVALLK